MTNEERYSWPSGKKSAAILSIDFDGPSPYLWANRDSGNTSLGELELRRFGPRQGVFRLANLFKSFELKITAFVPGAVASAHPDAVSLLIEDGHELAMHGFMHENVKHLNSGQFREVMEKSINVFQSLGINMPLGFRSPSWELTPDSLTVLDEYAVAYDSSLMGYDRPYWMSDLVEIPVQWPLDDAIFYRYVPGSNWPPVNPRDLMSSWQLELQAAKKYGTLAVITLHPWLSGRASRTLALEEFLDEFRADDDIWWTTASEVAHYHRSNYADLPRDAPRIGEL